MLRRADLDADPVDAGAGRAGDGVATRAEAVAAAKHLIAHQKHPLQYTLVVARDR